MKANQIIAGTVLLASLFLSACGSGKPEPTPTQSMEQIQTAAVVTFAAGLTQTAILQPTATLTPTPIPTNTLLPTIPVGPASTATLAGGDRARCRHAGRRTGSPVGGAAGATAAGNRAVPRAGLGGRAGFAGTRLRPRRAAARAGMAGIAGTVRLRRAVAFRSNPNGCRRASKMRGFFFAPEIQAPIGGQAAHSAKEAARCSDSSRH